MLYEDDIVHPESRAPVTTTSLESAISESAYSEDLPTIDDTDERGEAKDESEDSIRFLTVDLPKIQLDMSDSEEEEEETASILQIEAKYVKSRIAF